MTEIELMDYLETRFGKNEPIFTDEIEPEEVRNFFFDSVEVLVADGLLTKYEEDIYYIHTNTILGKSTLSWDKVRYKKYIYYKSNTIGFYSGITLLNKWGLTEQVPNIIEITTNKAVETKKLIEEHHSKVELKKPITEITNENVYTLQLLEAGYLLHERTYYNLEMKDIRRVFQDFITEHNIIRKRIEDYIAYYPNDVRNSLCESGLIERLNFGE